MDEPLSIGTFYFKSIQTLQNAIKSMIETQEKVADEYFPSQAFNHLLKQGQTVTTYPVDFFAHWGTPEQLEDALYWAEPLEKPFPKTPITNLCCMGQTGSRMKQIDPTLPKACLPLLNVPM